MAHRYDVFLSHSSADKPAVEKLAQKLLDAGLSPFLDKWHLVPGEPWQEALEEALDESRTCAVFLGPTGIGPWQNEEMRSALADRVSNKAFRVIPVLLPHSFEPRKADLPRFLRRLTWVDFRAGLEDEEAFRRLIHGIQGTAPGPSGSGGGTPPASISYRCMAQPPEGFIHRSEYEKVFEALCHKYGMPQASHSVGITTALRGAGGFGKTALAQAICFDERIRQHYPDGILWTTMGESLDPENRLSRILDLIRWWTDTEPPGFKDLEAAGAKLREILNGRRVLVVLDDVWSPADVAPFRGLGNGSAVLITTRDRQTLPANSIPVDVDAMAPREAVSLLRSELPKGQDREFALLAAQLGEWPLLLKLVNRQLRDLMNRDDLTISDALREIHLALNDEGFSAFDQDDPESRHAAASRTILVSVRRLSEKERDLYFQLAVFPEDAEVPISLLEGYWQLSPFATRKLCGRLYDLSLLRDFETEAIRLHDVVRKILIEQIGTDLPSLHARLLDSHWPASGHWADLAEENQYLWRNLAGHLLGADRIVELRSLLADFSFLEAKLKATDVNAVISDYTNLAGEEEEFRLVQDAIRLSAHILGRDKRQLASQLIGRLLNRNEEHIRKLMDGASSWNREFWLRPRTASLTQPGGALIRVLEGHTDRVTAVAVLDGRRAVSASDDGTLRVWDLESGRSLKTLEGQTGSVTAVAVFGGHRAITSSDDGTLRVWDLESGRPLETLKGHRASVFAVAVLDSRRAVSASLDRTLQVWDLESGLSLKTLEGHTARVTAVAVLDSRRAVSASDDWTLRVWDLERGYSLKTLEGHTDRVTAVAVMDGGHAVSASKDGTLRVWDLESGQSLKTLEGHTAEIYSMVVLDGCLAVSISNEPTLLVWDLESGRSFKTLEGHTARVAAVAVLDNRYTISASDDWTLRVWDLERGNSFTALERHTARVTAVTILDSNRAVSASADETLRVWDLESGCSFRIMEGHKAMVTAVAVLDRHRIVSSSDDGTLRVWDLESGCSLQTLEEGGHNRIYAVLVLDGHHAVSSSSNYWGRLEVWNPSYWGWLEVWNLDNGRQIKYLRCDGLYYSMAPLDGSHAVSVSADGTLQVWRLESGKSSRIIMEGHASWITAAAVVDSYRVVSGSSDGRLRMWDLESELSLKALEGHTDLVRAVAVFDDHRAVSASIDGTLRVWDLEDGEALALMTLDAPPTTVAVSSDGRIIVAGDQSGRMHFFDFIVPE